MGNMGNFNIIIFCDPVPLHHVVKFKAKSQPLYNNNINIMFILYSSVSLHRELNKLSGVKFSRGNAFAS